MAMSANATIPADGPDAVLARVASLLNVPLARGTIERSLAAHPRPTSLVALVDVGKQIGLNVKPVKANGSALGQLDLPAIVHVETADGGGFAVLEQALPDGVRVWDRAGGSRVIDRETFVEHWS